MFDPRSEEPIKGRERWIALGLFALIAGAFAADFATRFEPAKLSIPFMLLAWAPLLVLHEAAHAWVARRVGWRIHGIVIGFGRPVARRTLAGVPVEIRMLPLEGFVLCSPRELEGVRWKSVAIYAAGPGIELLLALAMLAALGPELLARSESVGVIALQSVALASVLGGILNLMPHSTVGPGGELPSDGFGIWLSLTRPLEDWKAELRRRRFFEPDDA